MLYRIFLTCVTFFVISSVTSAQYEEFYYSFTMEGQNPSVFAPAGLEDPSFEFPFALRPRQDKIFVSKDFETNDFSAVQSLTRSWVGTEDEERVLGRKFLRINGTGGVANWFPIVSYGPDFLPPEGPTLGHYVTVRAKQDGPFEAIFGINYFDANWNLIQKNSALISGAEAGVSRGDGDLLKQYVLPARVPFGASFGQVWIAAPYANGTTTFDFLNVFTEWRTPSNASFNPNANLLRNASNFFLFGDYQKTGYEFWNPIPGSEPGIKIDRSFARLSLGQPGRITNLYQVFDVLPNQPYATRLAADTRPGLLQPNALPHARGWFGIDFFDSNANKIDQVVHDLTQGRVINEEVYNPVPNVDFAIAWFYVEPLFRDEAIAISVVDVHIPFAAQLAAASTSSKAATSSATARIAPKSSKRSAKAPASPITPAIALQAKGSLPTAPQANKPTAKSTSKKTSAQKPAK